LGYKKEGTAQVVRVQGSGRRAMNMFPGLDSGGSEERRMKSYRRLEDLVVYQTYEEYRARYQECIRMLNGMKRTLEK
jgi:hypothetical protein